MSDTVYARSPDVVWRLGPDRVLVRRVGGQGEDAAAELFGEAALAWIALDEPATREVLSARIAIVDDDSTNHVAVEQLLVGGWIRTTET